MDLQPLVLIPARLGSTRLPRKVLQLLGGRTLLEWTVTAALTVFHDEDVWVSTEAPEVGELAERLGAVWHHRDPRLSLDGVSVLEVARSLNTTRTIYLMVPTCPFRTPGSIEQAWKAYHTSGMPGLISLREWMPTPYWALWIEGGRSVKPLFPAQIGALRQHLTPLYRHDGGHYILSWNALWSPLRDLCPFFPPLEETLDIDTPEDLAYARFLVSTTDHRHGS